MTCYPIIIPEEIMSRGLIVLITQCITRCAKYSFSTPKVDDDHCSCHTTTHHHHLWMIIHFSFH